MSMACAHFGLDCKVYMVKGSYDLVAYQQYNDGTMTDYIPTDEDLAEALKCVPPQPEE